MYNWLVVSNRQTRFRMADTQKKTGANQLQGNLPFYLRPSILARYGLPVSTAVIHRRTHIGPKGKSAVAAHFLVGGLHDPGCPWRPH